MQPGYLKLWQQGILQERAASAFKHYDDCALCPHLCGVKRSTREGICGAPDQAVVASFGPHFGEERVLVGKTGSGTIFFSHCNLGCVFCQNYELSRQGRGRFVSPQRLGEMMLTLQTRYRCTNLNLVTPTHFLPSILEALCYAAKRGLCLPLVYNCGGYERQEVLALLDGVVDIYLPDFKYSDPARGLLYSGVEDYPLKARKALLEMDRQVGGLKLSQEGLAVQGLLIRHLLLPGGFKDCQGVLDFIKSDLSRNCLVNLMGQYYPHYRAGEYPEIQRRLTTKEYSQARNYALKLGLQLA